METISGKAVVFIAFFLLIGTVAASTFALNLLTKSFIPDPDITKYNSQLVSLSRQYDATHDSASLESIRMIAQARKNKMMQLAEDSPQVFLASRLQPTELASLPSEIQTSGLIEQPVTTQGEVTKSEIHDESSDESETEFIITDTKSEKAEYALSNDDLLDDLDHGNQAQVEGVLIGSVIVVDQVSVIEAPESLEVESVDAKLVGDTNQDKRIDYLDYTLLTTNYDLAETKADFNGNGKIDIYDYNRVISHFNKFLVSPPPTLPLPEK